MEKASHPSMFPASRWISWLGAIVVVCMTLSAFAFQTFETKDDAKEKKADMVQRLDRIENKLDLVIQRGE